MLNDSIKDQVKSKLKELGAFVDDELPDYIMVMVANKKSKEMMMEDLQLFLSSDTEKFCDWLHDDLLKAKNRKRSGEKKKKPVSYAPKHRSRSPHTETKDILSVSFNSENEFDKEEAQEKEAQARQKISYKDLDCEPMNELMSSVKVVNRPDQSSGRRSRHHQEYSGSKIFEKAVADAEDSIHNRRNTSLRDRIGYRNERNNNRRNNVEHNNRDDETLKTGSKRTRPDIKSRLGAKVVPDNHEMETDLNPVFDSKRQQLDNDVDQVFEPSSNHLPSNLERCRFWPNCNKPEECNFIHPTEACKEFPNCKSSSATCLFIHPKCKFDNECTRPDCIYMHTKSRSQALTSNVMTCKFFPHCTNLACPYIHPVIPKQQMAAHNVISCRYGGECRNRPGCPYEHPKVHKNTASSMKWVNPNLIKKPDQNTINDQQSLNVEKTISSSSSVQLTV